MHKATYAACSFLALAVAASAKSHTLCGMCPAGKAMKANAKTIKTKACLADDRYVDPQCYACMKKAFSRTFPVYPECLNCNYTGGKEVFCPDTGMGDAECGISASTTCENAKNRVTRLDDCPKKTEAEKYSWCPEIMGEPECSSPNPTKSFQCDEGNPVASSDSSWAACPRKKDVQDKDPECAGCLDQHRDGYYRKVESCYRCFKDGGDAKPSKAWCPDIMGEPECGSNTGSFICDSGTKATSISTCPNDMSPKYNTTGVPGWVPEVQFGYCADVMGEPWCQKNPTASFQCDEGNPVLGKSSAACPDIKHESLWDPPTIVKDEAQCAKGPSKMEEVTCDQIQEKIKKWSGSKCMETKLAAQFGAACCQTIAKNTTSTGGVSSTVSRMVLATAGTAGLGLLLV